MAPSGVVAATELGRTSQSYHSLFLSSEWEWPGWLTVHLLCFEHFGLNTGPCAYEASALLMNSSTCLLFIFSILSLLGIKAFPVWKNSRKGGSQHTCLETCCSCPRGRCVTSLSEPVSWWLVWSWQQGNAEGPVHGWRLGRKGEELSLFPIKSCSSLHGKKPFQYAIQEGSYVL